MTTPSERYGAGTRRLLAAAAIGAIGAPLLIAFLVFVWAPVDDELPALGSLPVMVMLAAPIGLLAGTFSAGIRGFLAFWAGAFAGTLALAIPSYEPSLVGLGAVLAVLVIPQSVLPGYILARIVDRAVATRRQSASARIATVWLIPSVALVAAVGVIGFANGAGIRGARQPSCAALSSNVPLTGEIVFTGSHAVCVADLTTHSVRQVYGSPTDVDEELLSPRWSPDGSTIAVVRHQRPTGGGPTTSDIALIREDGTGVTSIEHPEWVGSIESLDWASDGARLVVAADEPGCGSCGQLQLVTIAEGRWISGPPISDAIDVRYPSWSPIHDRLLVSTATTYDESTYARAPLLIIDPDGHVLATVADDADMLSTANWSRDGLRLAFGRRHERGVDVHIGSGEGATPARLTVSTDGAAVGTSSANPVWSPDGRFLAVSMYASNELPHSISIVPAGGGTTTLLIGGATDFDWTP
jgi:Tol biopolymer transport system component